LAGGKNMRMKGKNKAFLQINRIPLIEKTIDLFAQIFDEIMIITNEPQTYKTYTGRCAIIEDKIKDIGPLGGIYTGLLNTDHDAVFFVACDMPNLQNDTIQLVISGLNERYDAVVPRIGFLVEPLHSVYRKELSEKIHHFIESGRDYCIRSFLQTVNVSYLDLEDNKSVRNTFKNVNTLKDWEKMNRR